MRRVLLLVFIAISLVACEEEHSNITVHSLRCEYLENPLAVDTDQPRFTWLLASDELVKWQRKYQILVASSPELLAQDSGDLWNSKSIEYDLFSQIKYEGIALKPGSDCYWKVRVWDEDSLVSKWSEPGFFKTGIKDQDWKARWIGFDLARNDTSINPKPWANNAKMKSVYKPMPASYLRHAFSVEHEIESAYLYATALGNYVAYLNGKRVSKDYFAPGWTDYNKRIHYQCYRVDSLLNENQNVMGAILADGWYAGNVANKGQGYYGANPRFKAQLIIHYKNGLSDTILTNPDWKAIDGPIREADQQAGETYDARLELDHWADPSFDDHDWHDVAISDTTTAPLLPHPSLPIQITEKIKPTSITRWNNNRYIVDMGQNFAGWAEINLSGNRGDSIVLRFAEALENDSTLYTRNLRSARATDTYVFKGDGKETWQPSFTYHGYRYIEVSRYNGPINTDAITGIVAHSNLEQTGSFECSNEMVNKLYSNILWSQRSNYIDIPTDCPQRDERMGWTGDAQVFMNTAAFNMNVAPFFKKWLRDVADGQDTLGRFPSTAPKIFKRIAAAWGDAGVIIPYKMLQWYADTASLKEMYPHMKAWMDYRIENTNNYIADLGSYGDWQNVESETEIKFISTAYLAYCAQIMYKSSTWVGKYEDAKYYYDIAEKVRYAMCDSFFLDSARIKNETQTAYLLALHFNLIPGDIPAATAVEHLERLIYEQDTTLSTGILGTQLLLPVLSRNGKTDLAYKLLLNEKYPSWGYQINQGATTIWERWNSYQPDPGFYDDKTNSLNHYAYGAVGEWLFSDVAGIKLPNSNGLEFIELSPKVCDEMTYAKASYQSINGLIECGWSKSDSALRYSIQIPVNTSAQLVLPSTDYDHIKINNVPLKSFQYPMSIMEVNNETKFWLGSGHYEFDFFN